MDPVTISLLVSGASAGAAGVAWLIKRLRERKRLPPPNETEAQRQTRERRESREREEAERRRQEDEERRARQAHEEAQRRAARERLAKLQADNLAGTIARIATEVVFTAKRIKTGRRKIDERAVGMARDEVPFPAHDVDVRPLRDMGELHRALPAEAALDDDQFFARAASGELLIGVDVEERTIYEPVYEEVWEERQRTLILVLDVSPSVFPIHNPWMPPVWKGLTLSMIDKAEAAEALMELHEFDDGDRGRYLAHSADEFARLRTRVARMPQGSGTNIGGAVVRAIERLEAGSFDQAQIMLVTDGEDHGGINPDHVRQRLEAARVALHVVLLGVTHQSLLSCADTYQIVENTPEGPTVRHRVTRS